MGVPIPEIDFNSALLQSAALAQAPVILVQPLSQSVPAGATVTFGVAASGSGQLQYQWKKNGVDLAGQAGATLTINSATSADAGDYSVVVSNNLGSTTSAAARLTVGGVQAPSITVQPVNQSVTAGAKVTFKVSASGSAPLSFQWKKNGIDLAGQTSSSLNLNAVTTGDAGNYSVAVSNAAGTTTSTIAALTVTEPAGPVIVVQPLSQTVEAGARVTFNVSATGSGQLSYQWKRSGVNLSGQTGATLTINAAAETDEGDYTVVVSNSVGTAVSAVATLDVGSSVAPRIVLQPIGQSVDAGGQVVLRVTATGSAPLTFQWRKNGANLSGQTGVSLTLNNVSAADAGDYSVVVANSAGTETSAAAKVDVTAATPDAPVIVVQPISQTVPAGAKVSFTVAAEGTGQLRYQWKKNGADLAGQTSATLSLSGVTAIDAGDYSVVVSNEGGATISAGARLTVGGAGAPVITVQPASQTVTAGGSVTLTVSVDGTAPLLFQWKKNGVNADGSLDASFGVGAGANDDVLDAEVQADGKIVIGGEFTALHEAGRNRIGRLNADGSLDGSFNVGAGANGPVRAVAIDSNGKVIIAGDFATVNGQSRPGIARLNGDGSLDINFNVGAGANGPVTDAELQSDGKIVIAGEFTSVQGAPRLGVARLNVDGSLDASFAAGLSGTTGLIHDVEVQSDGKVLVSGSFGGLGGIARVNLARLNADGSVDAGFNANLAAGSIVADVEAQADGKVLVGGQIAIGGTGTVPEAVVRLNGDGSVDTSFDASVAGPVADVELQGDGKILVGSGASGVLRLNGSISLPQGRIVRLLKSGATVELSVATEAGKTHVLETQTDITAQNWTEFATAVGDGSVKVFTDASATGSVRFYRVRIR